MLVSEWRWTISLEYISFVVWVYNVLLCRCTIETVLSLLLLNNVVQYSPYSIVSHLELCVCTYSDQEKEKRMKIAEKERKREREKRERQIDLGILYERA